MNFDTNVIGPSNINLIGGGSGLQLQQDTCRRVFPFRLEFPVWSELTSDLRS